MAYVDIKATRGSGHDLNKTKNCNGDSHNEVTSDQNEQMLPGFDRIGQDECNRRIQEVRL